MVLVDTTPEVSTSALSATASIAAARRARAAATEPWPREVELIVSALEAGQHGGAALGSADDRRYMPRQPYRRRASLRLFADVPGTPPWRLYVRDINHRGLGFLTGHRLPLGYGGVVELPGPDGQTISANCTLLRCRQVTNGWFEGALYFNREQMQFLVPDPEEPPIDIAD